MPHQLCEQCCWAPQGPSTSSTLLDGITVTSAPCTNAGPHSGEIHEGCACRRLDTSNRPSSLTYRRVMGGGQRLEDRGRCTGQLVGGVDGSMPPRLVEGQGSQGAATCSRRICEPPWRRGMILAMTVGGARIGRRVATALLLVLLTAACTRGEQPRQRPGAEPGPRPAVSW